MTPRTVVIAAVLAGCVADTPEETSNSIIQEVDTNNGTSLNGTSLNGTSLNGTSLSGTTLGSVAVSGKSSTGATISATLNNSASPLVGTSFVGSTWNGTASNGAAISLRIDSAQQGTATNADLWFYGVSFKSSATAWSPLCGAGVLAVPVYGVWAPSGLDQAHYATSTTAFTFACRAKTVAKCVELGYKPFKGYSNQMQSCVRLLRADYCGLGTSYTVDGTLLNLWDNVNVQKDTEKWDIEGEWGVNGSRCVSNIFYTRFSQKAHAIPPCLLGLVSLSCGSFRSGTYLIDELAP